MVRRILRYLRRKRNARRLKTPFHRKSSFQMPAMVTLDGRSIYLAYPDELGISNDFVVCFVDDEYGLWRTRLSVSTVADIGSNVGFFSLAARSRFSGATIHAYEPNRRVLSYLSKNAAAGGFDYFSEAVGAKEGCVWMEDAGDSNQARASAVPKGDASVCQVPLTTVVDRLGGWIDLAKIDCEGAEWEMFTDRNPWQRIGDVRMEYHLWGRRAFCEVREALRDLGFEIYYHKPDPSGGWGMVWARNAASSGRPAGGHC